jgi:transposase
MRVLKQSVGIDIAKDSFTACICKRALNGSLEYSEVRTFKNQKTEFNQLLRWVRKECEKPVDLVYLMEATGVYYESLAHHLFGLKKRVVVVLPNTSKHYFNSLNVKTKTDEVDAKILAQFGAERNHKPWIAPSKTLLKLRNLTRYYVQLQEQRTALNNIKHSKESAHDVQSFILTNNRKLIQQIDNAISKIKSEVEKHVDADRDLKERIEKILTLKGVGLMTVVTVLAETNGFNQVQNLKQLASFAGYDVVQRESGTSIKGKTKISKKGNRYIRNALYFPAMVACRYNPELRAVYQRIIQKKASKMIGQVAIQRKLLLLIYTLWKNKSSYIENYQNKIAQAKSAQATLDSSVVELP